jgi:hypothetical protein
MPTLAPGQAPKHSTSLRGLCIKTGCHPRTDPPTLHRLPFQGIKWIKSREAASGLVILQQSQPKYVDKVLACIEQVSWQSLRRWGGWFEASWCMDAFPATALAPPKALTLGFSLQAEGPSIKLVFASEVCTSPLGLPPP